MGLAWLRSQKSVRGRVVLVTGGALGIGRHMGLRFASLGALVVVWDVNTVAGRQVVQEIAGQAAGTVSGGEAHFFEVNVADRERVEEVGKQVVEQLGGVDILVNNAGIYHGQSFLVVPAHLLERTMQVNALAHFWTIRAFLPVMLKRGGGHIVCVSSAAGYLGFPAMVDYCASKFATVGLMSSLQQELRLADPTDSIRLTLACPSFTSTGMFEGVKPPVLTTWLSPEYAAEAIVAAVRRDQWRVLLPSVISLVVASAALLPVWVYDWALRVTRTLYAMQGFRQTRVHAGLPLVASVMPEPSASDWPRAYCMNFRPIL